jgi:sec-independent protein translocase protein TatA
MLNALEPWHLLIIVGVLVVLFGAKRLPGSARSLGRSMRIFRSEMANGQAEPAEVANPVAPTTASLEAQSAPPVAAG